VRYISISFLFIPCCSDPRFIYYPHISSCHNPNSQACARANYFGTDSNTARVTFYQLEIHRLLRNSALGAFSGSCVFNFPAHTAGGRPDASRSRTFSDVVHSKSSPRERNKKVVGPWAGSDRKSGGGARFVEGIPSTQRRFGLLPSPPGIAKAERGLEGAHSLSIQTSSYHETGWHLRELGRKGAAE